ncbi:MAG: molybdopterin-guanine dinucleotide biosynthesis protein B [Syntrophales bacterium]|jgi:molybdopterin-guanine dinucleotide biosynthesis protein B|nr:molybdopterin-guanine dinucleotide biosynthesis protein B [Syntrophales bacterium]MDY0043682.1 molybdopterin-guanine dinucleotide biosynthesis protein B [Syntrophales bacterium]
MPPILSIVGKSNSGKTTLIEKMIPLFVAKGYRIATIKHNRHGFDIDHEGKDSWRHKKAGAFASVIASPGKAALVEDTGKDLRIEELAERYIRDADLILAEGFKDNPFPKIEVSRKESHHALLCTKKDNLIAIAADAIYDKDVPLYDINDIEGLVLLIEEKFLKKGVPPSDLKK